MELFFGYLAGILTLINPCVLPVLPIVLASALQAGRHGPLAIAAGMSCSFVVFGMVVATIGHTIGLTENVLSQTGAVLMMVFGMVLLIPQLNERFVTATAGISGGADAQLNALSPSSMKSQFIGGMLLGAVWSPCIGPTLGGAISLASQGEDLFWVFAIMSSFALGVSSVILALGYGTREAIRRRQAQFRGLAERAKPIMGGVFLMIGLVIFFKIHYVIEAWLVDVLPHWFLDLSTIF
ncbi:MAG: cytochrome c biogenesis CcdA family protein [Acidiferrobacterales bacterium]|nr:cytochrome c biogenesis CcdA family protein [Acidiferrobacterales bacterium]